MKPIALSHGTRELRVVVVSLFTAALSACGGGGSEPVAVIHQAASAPSSGASQASSTPLPVTWPTPAGPARVFDYASAAAPVSDYTRASRFVLYDNGTFQLQLFDPSSGTIFAYSGRYAEASAVLNFDWDAASKAGPWGATGTLDGTSLTVQYNLVMQLTDFETAVYALAP